MTFPTLEAMVVAAAEAVRPPERIDVPTAAERYHIIKTPGQHAGPFSLAKTPYLREPMEVLTSLDYTGMVFCGPARTGKSAMFINWLAYTAIADPVDMMIVHMTQATGREWSKGDLAKALRHSTELAKRLVPGKQNDNVYDKAFLSGMRLSVTWPTIDNLSSKTIPRLWIMDMDRIKPQIIDKEGHVFDLTKKRAGTFKRYGMCGAEASPGFPVTDPKWSPSPSAPHEAPPCEGILSVYNRGDRRRWHWQCLWCGDWFEPRFSLMDWPKSDDHMESAEGAWMSCPHCYQVNQDKLLFSHLPELNGGGRWLKEGQRFQDGEIVGAGRRSEIASFWMFGPAAGLATDWKTLVLNYLRAKDEFARTGSDGNLMTTVTVDQGEAYVPPALLSGLLPETLKQRAEDWGGHDTGGPLDSRAQPYPFVPAALEQSGFLMAMVDVQAGGRPSFVVHVFAVTDGADIWHVDMFKITKSARINDATGERHDLDPASYPEDWDLLRDEVIERSYPLPDGSGRRMRIKLVASDSGGDDGVTANAYAFYRRLAEQGLEKRFHLLKGHPSKDETAPIKISFPGAAKKDRFATSRGDVPVWLIDSNRVKDTTDARLRRAETGGMIRFPDWAPAWLYAQLTNEVRMPDGKWKRIAGRKNEAWDLLAYCVAFLDHPQIRMRFLNWDEPPTWAAGWNSNDLVFGDRTAATVSVTIADRTLEDLAADLV